MMFELKQVVIELDYRGIVPVNDAVGARIHCLRGRIWITEQGSAADVVLEAGESYEISRDGIAIVQALREARVALRAPGVPLAGAALAERLREALQPRLRECVALSLGASVLSPRYHARNPAA